ncbi:metallophosphoesterase [Rhizobium sp. 2YAF20]|uniref:metallophosphoesterase n=1 Tax=Rhizobium sp. 2YAF20 TaxID=3233027 RepID=UPI003F984436
MAFTSQFFTADTHFGHALMLKDRPFTSPEEMDYHLIDAWNSIVRPDDIVWHLGDFSYHDADRTASIFSQLRGRKRLILGNHDLDNRGDVRKSVASLAWDQPPTHYAETQQDGERVILNHYAMRTWSASVHGSWHLFGHSHGKLPALGRSRDCGVDCPDLGFAPASFKNLTAATRDAEVVA